MLKGEQITKDSKKTLKLRFPGFDNSCEMRNIVDIMDIGSVQRIPSV